MRFSELTTGEKKFLDLFHAVERNGGPEYLALIAFMLSLKEGDFPGLRATLESASEEDLEHAVEVLREVPSDFPGDVGGAVGYIRREFLRKD